MTWTTWVRRLPPPTHKTYMLDGEDLGALTVEIEPDGRGGWVLSMQVWSADLKADLEQMKKAGERMATAAVEALNDPPNI